jgi:hypothetical protein
VIASRQFRATRDLLGAMMNFDEEDLSSGSPTTVRIAAAHFEDVFAAIPGVNLLLAADAPRFTMLLASDERLAATMTTRDATIGQPLFDVFPDANPENTDPSGVGNLRASLETVLRTRLAHRMAPQRYDLRRSDGVWEERYWSPVNIPVLGLERVLNFRLIKLGKSISWSDAKKAVPDRCQR